MYVSVVSKALDAASSHPPPLALPICVGLGVAMTMQEDAEVYFNESIGRKMESQIAQEVSNRFLPVTIEVSNRFLGYYGG